MDKQDLSSDPVANTPSKWTTAIYWLPSIANSHVPVYFSEIPLQKPKESTYADLQSPLIKENQLHYAILGLTPIG